MPNIREDFVGVTIVRDDAGQDHILAAGATVPGGVTVGDHLISGSAPKHPKAVAPKIPARSGPGSSAKAWREYATSQTQDRGLNIDIPEDASKADIITALEEAQIPTE